MDSRTQFRLASNNERLRRHATPAQEKVLRSPISIPFKARRVIPLAVAPAGFTGWILLPTGSNAAILPRKLKVLKAHRRARGTRHLAFYKSGVHVRIKVARDDDGAQVTAPLRSTQ